MEDLKIKIDNNLDELIELFVQMGCKYFNHTVTVKNYLIYESGKVFFCKLDRNFKSSKGKEITIDQLKDMVVLRRNDPKDMTHEYERADVLKQGSDIYVFGRHGWELSRLVYEDLKPITKEAVMKEFLQKLEDGTYKLVVLDSIVDRHDGLIEVPLGANYAAVADGKTYFSITNDFMPKHIIWQRNQSLNDQYAEIEKVRQAESLPELKIDNVNHPKHYNKGGVECISAIQASMSKESFCGYLKGNIVKYMWRYEDKGGIESLQKAQWYLNKLIENES